MMRKPQGYDEPLPNNFDTIGKKIKQRRKELGLSQDKLGEMLGVQKSAISKYETGLVTNIPPNTVLRLIQILGLSAEDFINWQDVPQAMQEYDDIVLKAQKRGVDAMRVFLRMDNTPHAITDYGDFLLINNALLDDTQIRNIIAYTCYVAGEPYPFKKDAIVELKGELPPTENKND